jgi:hypothetical protein
MVFDDVNLYQKEVEDFVLHLDNQFSDFPGTSIEDALAASCILDAISKSIEGNTIQRVLSIEEALNV